MNQIGVQLNLSKKSKKQRGLGGLVMLRMREAKAKNQMNQRGTGKAEATKSRINQRKAANATWFELEMQRMRKAKPTKDQSRVNQQEAKKPRSQEAEKPRNQAKKLKSQEANLRGSAWSRCNSSRLRSARATLCGDCACQIGLSSLWSRVNLRSLWGYVMSAPSAF